MFCSAESFTNRAQLSKVRASNHMYTQSWGNQCSVGLLFNKFSDPNKLRVLKLGRKSGSQPKMKMMEIAGLSVACHYRRCRLLLSPFYSRVWILYISNNRAALASHVFESLCMSGHDMFLSVFLSIVKKSVMFDNDMDELHLLVIASQSSHLQVISAHMICW
jgi:hypothetical protein